MSAGSFAADNISAADFDEVLSRYGNLIPTKLKDLEEFRLETIPSILVSRREESNGWLEKEELQQLVEWKLKHGTYRPSLAKLVASNSAVDVKIATKGAFAEEDIFKHPRDSLSHLTKLKGVGPATASLILSCYDPENIPFASDELFRWLHWDGKNSGGGTDGIKQVGKGWSRQIGYTLKEYSELCVRNARVRQRLEKNGRTVSSIEMEKVAYVLGKEQTDINQADGATRTEDQKDAVKELESPPSDGEQAPSLKTVTKRVAKSKVLDDTPRRSKRARTTRDD